jgi:very-short-patch-repair endonuclease
MEVIRKHLDRSREELLDLSTRNRLLNTPRHRRRTKAVEIVDEKSDEIFGLLVGGGNRMSFLPRHSEAPAIDSMEAFLAVEDVSVFSLEATEIEEEESDEADSRHTDTRLQTTLDSDLLRTRLLQLHYDARSALEEQGFNILYLALGFLKWHEEDRKGRELFSPLILLPAVLTRTSARAGFRIEYSDEELSTNLSLQKKLQSQFSVALPDLPDVEDLTPSAYFEAVRKAVANRDGWEVLEDHVVLGIFSFSKFLMYQDLDCENWPKSHPLESHPLVGRLLSQEGFSEEPAFPDDAHVDEVTDPATLPHVLDADSSQTLAIEEVRKRRNLVIQGPPGTGKSQTIANLIAAAVGDGRTVLFVAEKRAALEVVKRRLDQLQLGDMCLELHSHKARKRLVLEDLGQTLALGRPRMQHHNLPKDLRDRRDRLNRHANVLHQPLEPSGVTPFRAIGTLALLSGSGVTPPEFHLHAASGWTRDDIKTREGVLLDHVRLLEDLGQPDQHPWRGVGLEAVLPSDVVRLKQRLEELRGEVARWRDDVEILCAELGLLAATPTAVLEIASLAMRLGTAPPLDTAALTNDVWEDRRDDIADLTDQGATLRSSRETVAERLTDEAWSQDLSPIRQALARHGESLFHLFSKEYRTSVRELKSFARSGLPKANQARIALLDTLARAKRAAEAIDHHASLGQAAFGSRWNGPSSRWAELSGIVSWVDACYREGLRQDFRTILARLAKPQETAAFAKEIGSAFSSLGEQIERFFADLRLDPSQAFDNEALADIEMEALCDRFQLWSEESHRLQEWIRFRDRDTQLRAYGLEELADRLIDGQLAGDDALDVFKYARNEALMQEAWQAEPDLPSFDGRRHDRIVEEFRDMDRRRMDLARAEVAMTHYENIPRGGSGAGELGLIRREIQKKRRHLPLRKLMDQAGTAVQRIKPVFMMSPMSVAQYLAPGRVEFDLLLIDEASQVQPVEALGAVARCRQMVVVGDRRQLPPTRFFDALLDQEGDDDENYFAGDLESILALAQSAGINARMLRWHYRSRHESLIAVSNSSFYDNRLFIVPSPVEDDESGVKFRFVENGLYDRGGTAVNGPEAEAVAEAVIRHAELEQGRSLGVGTFSVRQRDAVLDEIELRRRGRPDLEPFFSESGPEPFFVKNLETIQGDERDVIFVSVGYGRDSSGYMAMNFGPLSSDGGERRLNVLISRAKQRMDVFSSIRADDIDLNRTQAVGTRVLKSFLRYAEMGYMDVPEVGVRDPDSEFEEEIGRALADLGFEVVHQVGSSGFIVDLAIRDPDHAGRYLLGIECDGATYHSSRSARDRDRLRQQVLEDRGWVIHRIWSLDWYQDPEGELRKVMAAAEHARFRTVQAPTPKPGTDPPKPAAPEAEPPPVPTELEREDEAPLEPLADIAAYKEADFSVTLRHEPHEAPIVPDLRDIVARIVDEEGPVHGEEVARRVATLWGKERTGKRIQAAAHRALKAAARADLVAEEGGFWSPPGREPVLRDRADVQSRTLLKAEMLPPAEIRLALGRFVQGHVGCAPGEAVVGATRLFGFRRAGQDLKAVIENELRLMLRDELLVLKHGNVYLSSPGI